MRLLETILLEDKIEFITQNQGDKIMNAFEKDITPNESNYTPKQVVKALARISTKYLQTVVNWYIKGDFKMEDTFMVKDEIEQFEKLMPHLPVEQRDINRYKSSADMVRTLLKYRDAEDNVSNKELARKIKKGAKRFYKDEQITVVVPTTEKAACYYGKGTRWCTSAREHNKFDHYNESGKIYIILTHDGRKFQFHFEEEQFSNELDGPIDVREVAEKYPSIYKAFEGIAKKAGMIELIEDPKEEDYIHAATVDSSHFENMRDFLPLETQIKIVKANYNVLAYVYKRNMTPEMLNTAIEANPRALYDIPEELQTPEIVKKAIFKDHQVINAIKDPSVGMIMSAYENDKEKAQKSNFFDSVPVYWLKYHTRTIMNKDIRAKVEKRIRQDLPEDKRKTRY